MNIYQIESGFQRGVYNMALDEALLEWVRENTFQASYEAPGAQPGLECFREDSAQASDEAPAAESTLIVRTYNWKRPTLSLGVNQAVRDIRFLLEFYGWAEQDHTKRHDTDPTVESEHNGLLPDLVRRPTGGRAILHGEDISFSFITNDPAILRQSLRESYALFAGLVETTLSRLALPVASCPTVCNRDYLRSPVCFETKTPSDLVADNGQKLSGSAQLRRQGGVLQHGAAFLKSHAVTDEAFTRTLFEVTAAHYGQPSRPFPLEWVEQRRMMLESSYSKSAGEILANASTTSGSHLAPASC